MSNPLAQFVVNQLVPEGQNEEGRAYQLNETSVSPVRIVGYDSAGNPIEETICALAKSAKFVDRDGNICDVPLRTGRVMSNSPEAERYEQIMVTDLIRQGQIPLEVCPFTLAFGHIRRGALIQPKTPDDVDCGGRPGAERYEQVCSHMRAVIDERRAKALARTTAEDAKMKTMKTEDVASLIKTLGESFSETLASHAAAAAAAAQPASVKGARETMKGRTE